MLYEIAIIIGFTVVTITYSYFYLKRIEENCKRKIHNAVQKTSYWKKKCERVEKHADEGDEII